MCVSECVPACAVCVVSAVCVCVCDQEPAHQWCVFACVVYSASFASLFSIDRSHAARNGRLCRVAVTDLGEFAPAITIRGPRSSRMHSGFTHYAERYVESFTVTASSEKLVTRFGIVHF